MERSSTIVEEETGRRRAIKVKLYIPSRLLACLSLLATGPLIPDLLVGDLLASVKLEEVKIEPGDSMEVGGRVGTELKREEADEFEEVSMLKWKGIYIAL